MALRCILVLLLSSSVVAFGQLSEKKVIKKLGIPEDEVLYSYQPQIHLPAILLYNTAVPDSVSYLMDVVPEEINTCIETPQFDKKLATGITVTTRQSSMVDTLSLDRLDDKLASFAYPDGTDGFTANAQAKYVAIVMWNPETTGKTTLSSFKDLQKYAEAHPEYGIQLVFVFTDLVNEGR